MERDLPIRCRCGFVRGVASRISPSVGNRVVCYCDDCQAFAHWLGCAQAVLDEHGGTDIFQTSCARVEITHGREKLAALRLSDDGLMRWYADCCRSPIGNVMNARVPFVGLIVDCLDEGTDGGVAQVIGPVRGRVMARFARGDRKHLDAADGFSLPMIARPMWILLRAWLRGDDRRSPFFDANRHPVAKPRVLTPAEREELAAKRPA